MPITYDGGTNIITVTDDIHDFDDIYDAGVAGCGGVVSGQRDSQHLIETNLVTEDGSALSVIDNMVQVQICTSTNHQYLKVNASGLIL